MWVAINKNLEGYIGHRFESLAFATTVLLQLMPQNYFSREVKISIILSQTCIQCGLFLSS